MADTIIDGTAGTLKTACSVQGLATPLTFKRLAIAMPDSNYTLLNTEYVARHLDLTGTLSTGRNLVAPLTDGAEFVVSNGTTQTLTVVGATGSGVAIASGKTAIVRCDGTNWLRVTADI